MMEDVSLLLFYFMHQQIRCFVRRRAINHRRRRLLLNLQRNNQNVLSLQNIQTAILTLLVAAVRMAYQRQRREFWSLPRPKFGWFELISEDEHQSRYWKEHFRVHKHTFLRLVSLVAPEISKRDTVLRDAISTPKKVAIALWRLVVGGSFRDIATHFDVEKSTCVKITKEFCRALNRPVTALYKIPRKSSRNCKGNSTVSR